MNDELDWEVRSGLHHECSEYSPVEDIVEITLQNNLETLIKQKTELTRSQGSCSTVSNAKAHLRMLWLIHTVRDRKRDGKWDREQDWRPMECIFSFPVPRCSRFGEFWLLFTE